MGGRAASHVQHPYFLATGKWPPPGYGGHSDGSVEASAAQEPTDVELDDEAGPLGGRVAPDRTELATAANAAAEQVRPGSEARRTGSFPVESSSIVEEPVASSDAELESGQPPDAALEQLDEQKLEAVLLQRAVRMFLRRGEEPVPSGMRQVVSDVSNGLAVAVRAAIRALYKLHRADVCRSPERPDLPLSQEEAIGYLLADAVGRPLLAALDARPLGKRVDTKVSAAKDGLLTKLAAMPKAATEAARKQAAKSGESFGRAAFAAKHEADARAALLAKAHDPKLPAATVGKRKRPAEQAAVVTEEPEDSCTRKRRQLEELRAARPLLLQAASAADAALAAIEVALQADAQRIERAKRRRESLGPRPSWSQASKLVELPNLDVEVAEREAEEARWGAAVDTKLQQLEAPYEQADAAVEAAKAEQAAGKARERELFQVAYDANMKLEDVEEKLDRLETWELWAGALMNALARVQELEKENERLRAGTLG